LITDAQLRKAAEKSSDLYLRYVEQDYNSTPPHEFSASFEKKIRKLRKRADHPYFYKTLHKAAAVILAILIMTTSTTRTPLYNLWSQWPEDS